MKRLMLIALLAAACLIWPLFGCEVAEDAADEIDDDIPDILDEGDMNADTPDGWDFMFAIELSDEQADELGGNWYIPLDLLGDLPDIENQIVVAKEVDLEGYGWRLRFSTKAKVEDGDFKVDPDADLLGGAAGGHGAGVYAFYHSRYSVGFVAGNVKDCDGNAKEGILVTASDSPFFTYSLADGNWALPIWNVNPANGGDAGNSIEVHFQDGDCYGTQAIGTAMGENGKINAEPYTHEQMGDDTDIIIPDPVTMPYDVPPREPSGDNLDFEMCDFTNWDERLTDVEDGYAFAAVLDTAYATFFPNGDETCYAFLSTGGSDRQTATLTRTITVPEGATTLDISYDFISQEYEEWVGSGFNDVFTAKIKGAPDYIINRTINNTAAEGLWEDLTGAEAQGVGDIASSSDANQNPSGKIFDGHLKENARGPRVTDHAYEFTEYNISAYAGQDIILILTISDVGDKIYDSAVLIDYVSIE